MRLILLGLWLSALLACAADRDPGVRRESSADSVTVWKRQINDSLVRAALREDGARLEFRWVIRVDSAPPQDEASLFDPVMRQWLILNDTVVLDLSQVDGVGIGVGTSGTPVILELGMAAGDRFLSSTTRHVGSHLAVVLNGHLLVAPVPVVQTPLGGTVPVVHGVDSAIARELAERLRSALPESGSP